MKELRIGSQLGEAAEASSREDWKANRTSSTGWTEAVGVKEQFHPLVAGKVQCQSSSGEPGERIIMELNIETLGKPVVRSVFGAKPTSCGRTQWCDRGWSAPCSM